MKISKINQTDSNKVITNRQNKNTNSVINTKKSSGIKKIALTLAALSAIGVAAVVTVNKIQKGQAVPDGFKTLKDIKFKNGVATVKKNGEKFTGKIIDTLKNGDNIELEYADGIIQSSARNGSLNVQKTFQYENSKLSKIITAFKDNQNKQMYQKTQYGHRLFENGTVIKECFNHDNSIVVNNFEKEYGILTNTSVFDKKTKIITKIKSDASKKAEEIRNQGLNALERFQNGDCKKVLLKDGTTLQYNLEGDIIAANNAKNKALNLSETRNINNRKVITIKYPDGSRKSFIKNRLVYDAPAKGQYTEYFVNGQIKSTPSVTYRENGTLVSQISDSGSFIKYAEDGYSKLFEKFQDGSQKRFVF